MSETSGETSGNLIRQPHGGALLKGGVPGHQGGGGRPPSMVRAALLEKGWGALQEIESIMKGQSSTGQTVSPSQQIAAWKAMMELSLPKINESITVSVDGKQMFEAIARVFERNFPAARSIELLRELEAEVHRSL